MAKKDLAKRICECQKCGHQWIPRLYDYPEICPKCKSHYWDEE